MDFYEELKSLIMARAPLVYIETSEWERLDAHLDAIAQDMLLSYQRWNSVKDDFKGSQDDVSSPKELVEKLIKKIAGKNVSRRGITVIEYAERWLKDEDAPIQIGILARELTRQRGKHQVILASPNLEIPSIIRREAAVLVAPLPKKEDIKKVLNATGKEFDLPDEKVHVKSQILDAVRGLGTTEIRNAFAKAIVKAGKITAEQIPDLIAEKEQIIRKSGCLEFVKTSSTMQDIGGLGDLKKWLEKRKLAFGSDARKKKLNAPKGLLLLGVPGTGKSLSAKAVAKAWNMPLLRLDMGKIFGGLVGESEANMRNAIKTAESMAPCVLWIDEIEKGLGISGGERDGGTSARVFGAFLTWMQEKKEEIFVFATANDVFRLPPELLRKGRFDEIFFVDLPGKKARREIFKIHLESKKQNTKSITDEVISKTEGFSGAEIEAIVNEALFVACHEDKECPAPAITASMLCKEIEDAIPLSSTMPESIENLRELAKNRFRPANNEGAPSLAKKQVKSFPQEDKNPYKAAR